MILETNAREIESQSTDCRETTCNRILELANTSAKTNKNGVKQRPCWPQIIPETTLRGAGAYAPPRNVKNP